MKYFVCNNGGNPLLPTPQQQSTIPTAVTTTVILATDGDENGYEDHRSTGSSSRSRESVSDDADANPNPLRGQHYFYHSSARNMNTVISAQRMAAIARSGIAGGGSSSSRGGISGGGGRQSVVVFVTKKITRDLEEGRKEQEGADEKKKKKKIDFVLRAFDAVDGEELFFDNSRGTTSTTTQTVTTTAMLDESSLQQVVLSAAHVIFKQYWVGHSNGELLRFEVLQRNGGGGDGGDGRGGAGIRSSSSSDSSSSSSSKPSPVMVTVLKRLQLPPPVNDNEEDIEADDDDAVTAAGTPLTSAFSTQQQFDNSGRLQARTSDVDVDVDQQLESNRVPVDGQGDVVALSSSSSSVLGDEIGRRRKDLSNIDSISDVFGTARYHQQKKLERQVKQQNQKNLQEKTLLQQRSQQPEAAMAAAAAVSDEGAKKREGKKQKQKQKQGKKSQNKEDDDEEEDFEDALDDWNDQEDLPIINQLPTDDANNFKISVERKRAAERQRLLRVMENLDYYATDRKWLNHHDPSSRPFEYVIRVDNEKKETVTVAAEKGQKGEKKETEVDGDGKEEGIVEEDNEVPYDDLKLKDYYNDPTRLDDVPGTPLYKNEYVQALNTDPGIREETEAARRELLRSFETDPNLFAPAPNPHPVAAAPVDSDDMRRPPPHSGGVPGANVGVAAPVILAEGVISNEVLSCPLPTVATTTYRQEPNTSPSLRDRDEGRSHTQQFGSGSIERRVCGGGSGEAVDNDAEEADYYRRERVQEEEVEAEKQQFPSGLKKTHLASSVQYNKYWTAAAAPAPVTKGSGHRDDPTTQQIVANNDAKALTAAASTGSDDESTATTGLSGATILQQHAHLPNADAYFNIENGNGRHRDRESAIASQSIGEYASRKYDLSLLRRARQGRGRDSGSRPPEGGENEPGEKEEDEDLDDEDFLRYYRWRRDQIRLQQQPKPKSPQTETATAGQKRDRGNGKQQQQHQQQPVASQDHKNSDTNQNQMKQQNKPKQNNKQQKKQKKPMTANERRLMAEGGDDYPMFFAGVMDYGDDEELELNGKFDINGGPSRGDQREAEREEEKKDEKKEIMSDEEDEKNRAVLQRLMRERFAEAQREIDQGFHSAANAAALAGETESRSGAGVQQGRGGVQQKDDGMQPDTTEGAATDQEGEGEGEGEPMPISDAVRESYRRLQQAMLAIDGDEDDGSSKHQDGDAFKKQTTATEKKREVNNDAAAVDSRAHAAEEQQNQEEGKEDKKKKNSRGGEDEGGEAQETDGGGEEQQEDLLTYLLNQYGVNDNDDGDDDDENDPTTPPPPPSSSGGKGIDNDKEDKNQKQQKQKYKHFSDDTYPAPDKSYMSRIVFPDREEISEWRQEHILRPRLQRAREADAKRELLQAEADAAAAELERKRERRREEKRRKREANKLRLQQQEQLQQQQQEKERQQQHQHQKLDDENTIRSKTTGQTNTEQQQQQQQQAKAADEIESLFSKNNFFEKSSSSVTNDLSSSSTTPSTTSSIQQKEKKEEQQKQQRQPSAAAAAATAAAWSVSPSEREREREAVGGERINPFKELFSTVTATVDHLISGISRDTAMENIDDVMAKYTTTSSAAQSEEEEEEEEKIDLNSLPPLPHDHHTEEKEGESTTSTATATGGGGAEGKGEGGGGHIEWDFPDQEAFDSTDDSPHSSPRLFQRIMSRTHHYHHQQRAYSSLTGRGAAASTAVTSSASTSVATSVPSVAAMTTIVLTAVTAAIMLVIVPRRRVRLRRSRSIPSTTQIKHETEKQLIELGE